MNCLIIGASRGIGLALAKEYKNKGYYVEATTRYKSEELDNIANAVYYNIDVRYAEAYETLVKSIHTKFDIIIHNAGIWSDVTVNDFDEKEMARIFDINATAPMRTVKYLKEKLNDNGKLIFITSKMGSMTDNTSGGRYAYRMSKAALNAFGKSLAVDLKNENIPVALLHPGWVQTDMGGKNALVTPEQSASGIYNVADNLTIDNTGSFYNYDGSVIEW